MALVIVLWMLSLLIVLALGYSRMVRTETGLTANLVHFNQARAIAEAGVWQAVSELLKPDAEQQWQTDGRPYSFPFGAGRVKVRIVDEGGKIDLNTAGPELLYGLLNAVELPEKNALRLLQAVLDWRDRDNLARNHGAEDADYHALGYQYGAKDGPFKQRGRTTTGHGLQLQHLPGAGPGADRLFTATRHQSRRRAQGGLAGHPQYQRRRGR